MFTRPFLILSLSFFVLPRPAESAPAKLIVWHTLDRKHAIFLGDLAKEFEQHHAVSIQLETGMELTQALIEQKHEGQMPDAVFAPADLIGMAKAFDFSEVPAPLDGSLFGERVASTVRLAGKAWGAPVIDGNHLLLFVNRDLAPSLTTLDSETTKASLSWLDNDTYFLAAILLSMPEPEPFGFNANQLQKAYAIYGDLKSLPAIQSPCNYFCVTEAFYQGKTPYAINGDWALRDAEAALGDRLDVLPLPRYKGKRLPSLSTTHALFFPANSLAGKHRQILLDLAAFLQSSEVQKKWLVEARRLPVDSNILKGFQNKDPHMEVVDQAARQAIRIPVSVSTSYFWAALAKGYRLAVNTEMSIQEIEQYLQSLMARSGKEEGL